MRGYCTAPSSAASRLLLGSWRHSPWNGRRSLASEAWEALWLARLTVVAAMSLVLVAASCVAQHSGNTLPT